MGKIFNISDLKSRIETSVFYGDVQWGDKVKLIFKIKDPNSYCDVSVREFMDLIEDWDGHCVCTKDNIFLRDGFLEVTLDTSKTEKYPMRIPYETSFTVYWKDGQPRKKLNDFGQMSENTEKSKSFFNLYGSILPA